ncbi:hypothetical protein GGH94_000753 [Coemansia aciculifera]|uniref:Uncharacterized protein n=1 Tax=Coemansia aciculifera TaxID=417176 RepID=A0A9W8IVK5_9FUNG|nr:hypothetical protein GGH94_000753 [Coemansia aciculifera]
MTSSELRWRPFSNPAPLGNSAFAVSTFVTSLHTGAIGIASGAPLNIVVGLALFFGGMAQIIAGAWSFASNNGFGAVLFTSYGCYWMSYAAAMIPGFGIAEALSNVSADVRGQSWGIFNLVWTIQTFIFLLASLRSNWGTVVLLSFLLITYALSSIGHWTQSEGVMHASGYVGLVTALVAWYNAAVDMLNKDTFYCELPNPALGTRDSSRNAMAETPGHYVFDGRTPGNNFDFIATMPKHTVVANAIVVDSHTARTDTIDLK